MKKIISLLFFLSITAGFFAVMHKIQNSGDLDIKDLEVLVEKEIQTLKDLKRKHIDSH
jgi:hypothetical protein